MNIGERKMILAEGCEYSLNDYETKLTNNVLIFGSTGCGKTRGIVKPNLLQAYGSYIVSDPKGNLYYEFKDPLEAQGYKVYLLDFKTPIKSNHFNILEYVKSDDEIKKIAKMIVDCTGQALYANPYWANSAASLIGAVIALVKRHFPIEKQHMGTVSYIIVNRKVPFFSKEDYFSYYKYVTDNSVKGYTDDNEVFIDDNKCLFSVKEPILPVDINSYFVYLKSKGFSLATDLFSQLYETDDCAKSTKDCIYMEAAQALTSFASESIKEMLSKSDFKIKDIGNEKTAIFVSASDTDRSQDMLVNIFYSQCLNELCDYADNECENNRLPVDVRFILDDFATNCMIANFDKSIAMIRSRGISAMLMVQDINQLKHCYGNGGDTICANCDTWVYLGGNDMNTVDLMARQVNLPYENLYEMGKDECFIYRRGEKAIRAKKIDYDKHIIKFRKDNGRVA